MKNMFVTEIVSGWSLLTIIFRLMIAMAAAIIIGMDRGVKRRGAGVKTHVLVCLSAALVMLTGEYIYMNFKGNIDVARLGAQVISGVGFLGVGTIVITGKNQVRGLTTAAGLWACACIGLAAGIGFISGALIMCFLVLFTLRVMNKLDFYLLKNSKIFDIFIEFENIHDVSLFIAEMRQNEIKVASLEINKAELAQGGISAIATVLVSNNTKRATFMSDIRCMKGVKFVEEL